MLLGLSLALTQPRGGGVTPTPTPTPTTVTSMFMGQSELVYLDNPAPQYRAITQPTPGNGNLIMFTQDGNNVAPVRTVVNPTTVAAGQVNPAMASLSAALAYAKPGVTFVVGDGSVAGTSRFDLVDDSTDGSDGRIWGDFTSVATAIETEFGAVQNVIECWYNADAAFASQLLNTFSPFYFGTNEDGTTFTLGSTVNARKIDHCLWDATAASSAKGRGIFTRDATKWRVLTPMPFLDAPTSVEATTLAQGQRLSEPARKYLHRMPLATIPQSVDLKVGPSGHISRFGGASTEIHPDTANSDGQVGLMWPFFIALMRAAGTTINEPEVVDVEAAADGSYADLVVSLPNGGNLTTWAAMRAQSYSGSAPHQQAVTGVEIGRSGVGRRPVYKTSETSYPVAFRGTVTISDTGSGSPRRGRIRVTPTTPFAFGDTLSLLRGQATAALLEPRDFQLYPWFPFENIPSLYDATALYPFPGVAVKPYQEDGIIPVPAPAFTAQGANFDGADYYAGTGLLLPAGTKGLCSFWFRNNEATWNAGKVVFEARVSSTVTMSIQTASLGRFTFRLNQDGTGSDTFVNASGVFAVGAWAHVLWAWDYAAQRFQVYANGVPLTTTAYSFTGSTKFDQAGSGINQFSIGATTAGAGFFIGDIGHFYLNLNETLDLSVQANREKFALAGQPVGLGSRGSLPTGNIPEWHYHGTAPAWSNRGTAGNVPLTGALTPSSTAPSY